MTPTRSAVISIEKILRQHLRKIIAGLAVILVTVIAVGTIIPARDANTYHARIGSYRVDDPYRIVVYVSLGFADPVVGYDAREEADRVVLTIRARNRDFGPGTYKQLSASLASPVLVNLTDQLGDRTVVDENGTVVPRVSQDPLCGRAALDATIAPVRKGPWFARF